MISINNEIRNTSENVRRLQMIHTASKTSSERHASASPMNNARTKGSTPESRNDPQAYTTTTSRTITSTM